MADGALRGLFAALEEQPTDLVCLSALADWYEEQGDGEAARCVRWLIQTGKRPGLNPAQHPRFGPRFWEREGPRPILDDPLAQLRDELWLALADYDEKRPVSSFKSYQTVGAALQALVAAWKRTGGVNED